MAKLPSNLPDILRKHGLKTSLTELLDLLGALECGVVFGNVDDFYTLARLVLVNSSARPSECLYAKIL